MSTNINGIPSGPRDAAEPTNGTFPSHGNAVLRRESTSSATVGAALAYLEAGLSVLPIRPDGTKRPAVREWKPYQTTRATAEDVARWFGDGTCGIALVCGAVSRNLECLDFDSPGALEEFLERAGTNGATDLVERLVLVKTPRRDGGYHLLYRCEGPVPSGTRLAQVFVEEEGEDGKPTRHRSVKVETRGEGNYVLAPGSPGACHPTGGYYTVMRGDLLRIPTVTASERRLLVQTARLCDECPPENVETGHIDTGRAAGPGLRPGDEYNASGEVLALLLRHGWAIGQTRGPCVHLARPGKSQGTSATWNHGGYGFFYVFSSNAAPFEPDRGYTPFAVYAFLEHGGDFASAAAALARAGYGEREPSSDPAGNGAAPRGEVSGLPEAGGDGSRPGSKEAQKPAPSQATLIWRMVINLDGVELFHDPQGIPYITIPVSGPGAQHRETHRLGSELTRHWLTQLFAQRHGAVPSSRAVQDALAVLKASAQFDGPQQPVYIRSAWYDGAIYIDLCDSMWRAVQVSADGWEVVASCPVKFRRPPGLLPLPGPERGATLADLRPLVNVRDDDAFALLAGWLTMALHPDGPYPVLCLSGPQGSGKSTLARLLRGLIDPAQAPVRCEPNDPRDLAVSADNAWVVAFDNLSGLPAWLSDGLCRLATGGGMGVRKLYTDDEETVFDARRPVILTGISAPMSRADLIDRTLLLPLSAIDDAHRRTEADLLAVAEVMRPRLFGAILDAMATALRRLPETQPDTLPRMADFARWAVAGEIAYAKAGTFARACEANQAAGASLALEASDVATALAAFIASQPEGRWEGYTEALRTQLDAYAGDALTRSRGWPKNARAMSQAINRAKPALSSIGVEIQDRMVQKKTWRTITRTTLGGQTEGANEGASASEGGKREHPPSLSPHSQAHIAGNGGQRGEDSPIPSCATQAEVGREKSLDAQGGILPPFPHGLDGRVVREAQGGEEADRPPFTDDGDTGRNVEVF